MKAPSLCKPITGSITVRCTLYLLTPFLVGNIVGEVILVVNSNSMLVSATVCLQFSVVTYGADVFIEKPADTVVYHGDDTQLNCTFDESVDDKAWFHKASRIAKGRNVRGSTDHYGLIIKGDVYNLQVLDTTQSVSGTYTCKSQQNESKTSSAKLYIIDDVPDCSVSSKSTVIEGHDTVFRCSIDLAEEVPGHLVWLKSGEESYREEYTSKDITWITKLGKSDNGAEFDCQFQHKTLPRSRWSTLSCEEKTVLNVQYPPRVSVVTDSTVIMEGRSLATRCSSTDANPEEIVEVNWKNPNGHLIAQKEILLLESLTRHDSGNYTCYMSNIFYNGERGTGEASVHVDVQYIPSVTLTVHPSTIVTEGSSVTFQCKAETGNPIPHRMTLSLDEKYCIHEDGPNLQHTIHGVKGSDSGIYKCVANTTFHDGSQHLSSMEQNLTVYYSPKQVSASATYKVAIKDDVDMTCKVHGCPTPALKWLNNEGGLISQNDSNRQVSMEIHGNIVKSTLTVVVVDESYYGTYTCEAANGILPNISINMEIVRPASGSTAWIVGLVIGVVTLVILVILVIRVFVLKYRQKLRDNRPKPIVPSPGDDVIELKEITGSKSKDVSESLISGEERKGITMDEGREDASAREEEGATEPLMSCRDAAPVKLFAAALPDSNTSSEKKCGLTYFVSY